jgi:predicted secreted protein with PEFG-CTERM motif
MNGIVHVTDNLGSVQTIDKVASGFTDDGLGFEIKYILDTNLKSVVDVDSDEKTLTFHISGDTGLEELIIVLPVELINTPTIIWVDGIETKFTSEDVFTGTKLIIEMEPFSKEIKIMGASVIPEFGFLTISILSVGLISTLILTRSKLSII